MNSFRLNLESLFTRFGLSIDYLHVSLWWFSIVCHWERVASNASLFVRTIFLCNLIKLFRSSCSEWIVLGRDLRFQNRLDIRRSSRYHILIMLFNRGKQFVSSSDRSSNWFFILRFLRLWNYPSFWCFLKILTLLNDLIWLLHILNHLIEEHAQSFILDNFIFSTNSFLFTLLYHFL